ncbi:helix-turn-helix domain-containing protein [Flavobacterium litorale]|uniref:Helix-turn-helix domain-containing protein n=1 Tax=Flavobacterium litorale TaxID=2856519 RepID=A0ABX8V4Z8_9FLAO|nr:helix-turn-helix transcriptional regulator [Flavobacterium litorale]QYJ67904.1 helix-turn-helix domain-containing protein [Flavobacterium litorale]
MVNTDDFIKRLELILEYYAMSASVFADKLGVQRSGVSHLLSGRNKPSLDFVLKLVDCFPEVDLYWLLNGKGSFPKKEVSQNSSTPTPSITSNKPYAESLFDVEGNKNNNSSEADSFVKDGISNNNTDIERIVIFYKDGTFKNYISS